MSTLNAYASYYAKGAHAAVGQLRKYTQEPYWRHAAAVAALVASVGGSDVMVAAAYLHDVVEDTQITNDNIREQFGKEVAELVYWLTDISKPEDGNREKRKQIDREHIAIAPLMLKQSSSLT